ncbi:MAG TPA: acylneuraminate cytidylyltransferase family protein [Prosthecobacter sp.]|nr:acylneuraminate cytidylyltransferase family protein [Prosthecobacter sp.]HRK16403.1 acylneuraminate cytidylyltransferase family protein [Prosthecobacter sp.]
MKNIICTVCARGGSKGVPGKNTRLMHGIPLIQHTLRQAAASGIFTTIVASSDSEAILDCAAEVSGVRTLLRPAGLASDTAGKVPAIRHAMLAMEERLGAPCDITVDLDVTSPLRSPDDIRAAVALLQDGVPNVLTAMHSRRSPYFNLIERHPDGQIRTAKALPGGVLRRQDAPPCYDMNASIYVWRRDVLAAEDRLFLPGTALHLMPEERSWDIDSEMDWHVVELLMSLQPPAPRPA